MRRLIITILISFFLVPFWACTENSCSTDKKIRLLTGRKWEINSYIDYSVNREMSIIPEIYDFDDDGSFSKVKSGDTIRGSWMIEDCDYIKIGTHTFKIMEMSRKIMVLRFGEMDFVYRMKD